MAELTEKYGKDQLDAKLIEGSGGVFDVVVDGELLFSKKQVGRFPGYGEITMSIDQMRLSD